MKNNLIGSGYIFAVLLIFIFNLQIITISGSLTSHLFQWNYLGKLFEILWPLLIIYVFGIVNSKEAGFITPTLLQIILSAVVGVVCAIIFFGIDWYTDSFPPISLNIYNTIIFQFTLPGLAEELVYRGVLFGLLRTRFSSLFSIIFVSFLFILAHVPDLSLIDLFPLLVMTFVLGWLRIRTGSIWPGVVCHNIVNGFYFLLLF